jgi:2-polyprenyl-3-methyl-5-hydroxy-6-metoxy-1,4-benzoquinol methylase
MFNRRYAERDARAFRRRGLGESSRALVELAGNVEGETVLDVGGGIGGIGLELLARGASRSTTIELSAGYDDAASELARERGVADRIERRVGDVVGTDVETYDVVVMHRVVCCYPDADALLSAAAARTRRVLVLTYPQERRWIALGIGAVNLFMRISRCGFRTYAHPVSQVLDERGGLRLTRRERHGLLWESAALSR